jgi:hypothetical protein
MTLPLTQLGSSGDLPKSSTPSVQIEESSLSLACLATGASARDCMEGFVHSLHFILQHACQLGYTYYTGQSHE